MIDLENKRFKLANDKEYEVIEYLTHNNKTYVYLVNVMDELDSEFKELVRDNGDYYLDDIDHELFKNEILKLFINKINSD